MHYAECLWTLGGLSKLSGLRQRPWRDGRLFGTWLEQSWGEGAGQDCRKESSLSSRLCFTPLEQGTGISFNLLEICSVQTALCFSSLLSSHLEGFGNIRTHLFCIISKQRKQQTRICELMQIVFIRGPRWALLQKGLIRIKIGSGRAKWVCATDGFRCASVFPA